MQAGKGKEAVGEKSGSRKAVPKSLRNMIGAISDESEYSSQDYSSLSEGEDHISQGNEGARASQFQHNQAASSSSAGVLQPQSQSAHTQHRSYQPNETTRLIPPLAPAVVIAEAEANRISDIISNLNKPSVYHDPISEEADERAHLSEADRQRQNLVEGGLTAGGIALPLALLIMAIVLLNQVYGLGAQRTEAASKELDCTNNPDPEACEKLAAQQGRTVEDQHGRRGLVNTRTAFGVLAGLSPFLILLFMARRYLRTSSRNDDIIGPLREKRQAARAVLAQKDRALKAERDKDAEFTQPHPDRPKEIPVGLQTPEEPKAQDDFFGMVATVRESPNNFVSLNSDDVEAGSLDTPSARRFATANFRWNYRDCQAQEAFRENPRLAFDQATLRAGVRALEKDDFFAYSWAHKEVVVLLNWENGAALNLPQVNLLLRNFGLERVRFIVVKERKVNGEVLQDFLELGVENDSTPEAVLRDLGVLDELLTTAARRVRHGVGAQYEPPRVVSALQLPQAPPQRSPVFNPTDFNAGLGRIKGNWTIQLASYIQDINDCQDLFSIGERVAEAQKENGSYFRNWMTHVANPVELLREANPGIEEDFEASISKVQSYASFSSVIQAALDEKRRALQLGHDDDQQHSDDQVDHQNQTMMQRDFNATTTMPVEMKEGLEKIARHFRENVMPMFLGQIQFTESEHALGQRAATFWTTQLLQLVNNILTDEEIDLAGDDLLAELNVNLDAGAQLMTLADFLKIAVFMLREQKILNQFVSAAKRDGVNLQDITEQARLAWVEQVHNPIIIAYKVQFSEFNQNFGLNFMTGEQLAQAIDRAYQDVLRAKAAADRDKRSAAAATASGGASVFAGAGSSASATPKIVVARLAEGLTEATEGGVKKLIQDSFKSLQMVPSQGLAKLDQALYTEIASNINYNLLLIYEFLAAFPAKLETLTGKKKSPVAHAIIQFLNEEKRALLQLRDERLAPALRNSASITDEQKALLREQLGLPAENALKK